MRQQAEEKSPVICALCPKAPCSIEPIVFIDGSTESINFLANHPNYFPLYRADTLEEIVEMAKAEQYHLQPHVFAYHLARRVIRHASNR